MGLNPLMKVAGATLALLALGGCADKQVTAFVCDETTHSHFRGNDMGDSSAKVTFILDLRHRQLWQMSDDGKPYVVCGGCKLNVDDRKIETTGDGRRSFSFDRDKGTGHKSESDPEFTYERTEAGCHSVSVPAEFWPKRKI